MEKNREYHLRQFETPYRSTIAFDEFLKENVNFHTSKILDLACGGGANSLYFARKYPETEIVGMDIDDKLFSIFNEYCDVPNVKLVKGDWYHIDKKYINQFDGVISLQTLSWMENWEEPLKKVCELNPNWIAMSSLFYEGKINYSIKLSNYERPGDEKEYTECYYNIYSLPIIREYLQKRGYTNFIYEPFVIDIDIPKPDSYDIGTYTIKTSDNKRLQISAGLMLPWYFIFASK